MAEKEEEEEAGFERFESAIRMQYNQLGKTDMKVSNLGFGGSAIGSHYSNVDESEAKSVVRQALSSGINYIDTAPWYGFGRAEQVLGLALKGIPRDAYYVATKIGRYRPEIHQMFDFSAEKTLKSVQESLEKIGCGYLDIIQVHDLEFAPNLDIILNETLPTLLSIKNAGLARYIGITGYPLQTLKTVVERSRVDIDTVLSYCRCCLHDTELLQYSEYFKSKGLGVIDAAGLGMGLYTTPTLPDWHPAPQHIRQACQTARKYCQDNGTNLSRLALHFNLNQSAADTHLTSFHNQNVLKENLDVCFNGIQPNESQVLEDMLEKIFKPLKVRNWEQTEVDKYRSKLATIKNP
ncbi:hypothetical protein CHUAL_002767 [Chamberlinius hualienensis]